MKKMLQSISSTIVVEREHEGSDIIHSPEIKSAGSSHISDNE